MVELKQLHMSQKKEHENHHKAKTKNIYFY